MPNRGYIEATVDKAVASLKDSSPAIAELLHIEPPVLNFPYRDREYLQAEQLKEFAAFNQRVYEALRVQVIAETEPIVVTTPANGRGKRGKK